MPSPLHTPPAAGFDAPLEMLDACHARTQQRVDLLMRLDAHLATTGADASARDAARDLLRFFDVAAVHHHDDEERHLLPLLARTGHAALAERLQADHAAMRDTWAGIRVELLRVANGDALQGPAGGVDHGGAGGGDGDGDAGGDGGGNGAVGDPAAARRARWQAFADSYRAHLAVEESAAFPVLDAHTDAADRAAIGEDMAQRRGVASAGDAASRR